MNDLIILVADKNTQFLLKGLLPRISYIEKTRKFVYHIIIHIERDPGVYKSCHEVLRPLLSSYLYALVIMDKAGSGHENETREDIEAHLENNLNNNGWQDRAAAIVIDPELENWIWVKSKHLENAMTWSKHRDNLFSWAQANGFKFNKGKPILPKEAFESALQIVNTPRSSSIYYEISASASYKSCQDPSFQKLIYTLKTWFKVNL